jgi:hypothetical protein
MDTLGVIILILLLLPSAMIGSYGMWMYDKIAKTIWDKQRYWGFSVLGITCYFLINILIIRMT